LGGFALGAPVDSVRVDQFRVAAGGTERSARDRFGCYFGAQRFTGPELSVGLGLQLGLRAFAPIVDSGEVARPNGALGESNRFGSRELADLLLRAPSRGLCPRFVRASPRRARRSLADLQGFAVDTLMAQPLERLEWIAVPHDGQCSKAQPARSALAKLPIIL